MFKEQQEDTWVYECSGCGEVGDEDKEVREATAWKTLFL